MKAFETINQIRGEIREKQERIAEIQARCVHVWGPSRPDCPSSSFPICNECSSEKHGWWCPQSPTGECDYSLPSGRGFNPDSCRYCHQPEERK
ncbi:hypothetical protein [Tardiphaga sp.]|jgi:hypothetical protein|uniref:hypothetical protein n=1 Tax=Tardiphaga sp. TaxID=1926292 RepID=UPI0037DA05CE